MRRLLLPVAALAAGLTVQAARPRPAAACGGCFAPPETITTVGSHRMVISLSPQRTTLWDQIRYTGNPEDFVWVLPVPKTVPDLEVADPLFFDYLDEGTSPIVVPPPITPPNCPSPPNAGDDGDGAFSPDAGASLADASVDVIAEETVGPYETVTVASEDPDALYLWLTSRGYAVPEATLPTIAYYVERDSAFVVMRLAPEVGVEAMTPIRVRYAGYMASFPLRMVTVGASGTLDLSLWVIAEQRYEALNYQNGRIFADDLTWDWNTNTSDYAQVFRDRIDELGGAAWITEHASPLDWLYLPSPDDVAIARHDLAAPYVTRLRTSVLVDNLGQDLELGPALDPTHVDRTLFVFDAVGTPPVPMCPGGGFGDDGDDDDERVWFPGCSVGAAGTGGFAVLFAAAVLALILAARRRR